MVTLNGKYIKEKGNTISITYNNNDTYDGVNQQKAEDGALLLIVNDGGNQKQYDITNIKQQTIKYSCDGDFSFKTINRSILANNVESIDLSDYDYEVQDFKSRFYNFRGLKSLDLTNLNISNLTKLDSAFNYCTSLKELNVKDLYGPNIKSLSNTFAYCSSLQSIDLSGLDTSRCEAFGDMLSNTAVTNLDLRNFTSESAINTGSMFERCKNLKTLDLSSFEANSVVDASRMFNECTALTDLKLDSFECRNTKYFNYMFAYLSSLKTLDLTKMDCSNGSDFTYMFSGCKNLKSLKLGKNFFKMASLRTDVGFDELWSWNDETVRESLVINSYDRKTNKKNNITLKLSDATKGVLSEEDKQIMTNKGYVIA